MNAQKFKTPIELHRKLGNTYQVQVYERNLMRKQMKAEIIAEEQKKKSNLSVFEAKMLNKQLQLELELERLRSNIQQNHTNDNQINLTKQNLDNKNNYQTKEHEITPIRPEEEQLSTSEMRNTPSKRIEKGSKVSIIREEGIILFGRIKKINKDGTFGIKYDNGEKELKVHPDFVQLVHNDNNYYENPTRIKTDSSKGLTEDNSDNEDDVRTIGSSQQLRQQTTNTSDKSMIEDNNQLTTTAINHTLNTESSLTTTPSKRIEKGSKVSIIRGEGVILFGRIKKINKDGTFGIQFDNGERELKVNLDLVQLVHDNSDERNDKQIPTSIGVEFHNKSTGVNNNSNAFLSVSHNHDEDSDSILERHSYHGVSTPQSSMREVVKTSSPYMNNNNHSSSSSSSEFYNNNNNTNNNTHNNNTHSNNTHNSNTQNNNTHSNNNSYSTAPESNIPSVTEVVGDSKLPHIITLSNHASEYSNTTSAAIQSGLKRISLEYDNRHVVQLNNDYDVNNNNNNIQNYHNIHTTNNSNTAYMYTNSSMTNNNNNNNSNKMFVLSCAPILSVDNLMEKTMNSPSVGLAAVMGSSQQLTIQEQIYRFAEIKSLFDMTSSSCSVDGFDSSMLLSSSISIDNKNHFNSKGYNQTNISPRSQNKSINYIDSFENMKRKEEIERHKERLLKGRNPKIKYHSKAPELHLHMSSFSPRSKVHQIRYPQYNKDTDDYFHPVVERDILSESITENTTHPNKPSSSKQDNSSRIKPKASDKIISNNLENNPHININLNEKTMEVKNIPAKIKNIQDQIQLLQFQLQLHELTAPTTAVNANKSRPTTTSAMARTNELPRNNSTSINSITTLENEEQYITKSSHKDLLPHPPSTSNSNNNSIHLHSLEDNKSILLLAEKLSENSINKSISIRSSLDGIISKHTNQNSTNTINNNSIITHHSTTTNVLNETQHNHNNPQPLSTTINSKDIIINKDIKDAKNSKSPEHLKPTMSLEEFHETTEKINVEIEQAISYIVQASLLADGHSQHFTKRFQQLTMAKVKKPLEVKIQEKLGDKIRQLKEELEELRAIKLESHLRHHEDFEENMDNKEDGDILSGDFTEGGDSTKINSTEISAMLKTSMEDILKKQNLESDAVFLQEFQSAAIIAMKKAFKKVKVNKIPEIQKYDNNFGINMKDIAALRNSNSNNTTSFTPIKTEPIIKIVEEEEEDVKPVKKKLSKAERMLGAEINSNNKNIVISNNSTATTGNKNASNTNITTANTTATPSAVDSKANFFGGLFGQKNTSTTTTNNNTSSATNNALPITNKTPKSKTNTKVATRIGKMGNIIEEEISLAAYEPERRSVRSIHSNSNSQGKEKSPVLSPEETELAAVEKLLEKAKQTNDTKNNVKARLKQEIKDWQANFESRVGRPPVDADKAAIEDRFIAFQKINTELKDTVKAIKELEDRLQVLKTTIEAQASAKK